MNTATISNNHLSKKALFFCYAVMLFFGLFFYPRWQQSKTEATISWDVAGYYTYLPAFFIYNDYAVCSFRDSLNQQYQSSYDDGHLVPQTNGNNIIKYPSGQALLMTPFFLVAHAYCKLSSTHAADGYSFPYQLCIGIGFLLYAFLGLHFFRKLLLFYFSDAVVTVTVLIIGIGSNWLNYASIDQAMTHSPLFLFYALLLLQVRKYYANPNANHAIKIGLIAGLMTLMRPTEILCLLLVALWGVDSWQALMDRCKFVFSHYKHVMILALCFAIPICIQLAYWKSISGHWLVYSYSTQGFNWFHPYFKKFLGSYRCGWLRYTPIMCFGFLGMLPLLLRKHKNAIAIILFCLINTYIVCCWDIWWFGGRAMVQSYVAFGFAFAALVQWVSAAKWKSVLLTIALLAAAYINIWWTCNAHHNWVRVSDVTRNYSLATYGRWQSNAEIEKYLDNDDVYFAAITKADTVYKGLAFDSLKETNVVRFGNGVQYAKLDNIHQFTKPLSIDLLRKQNNWLRLYVQCKIANKEWDEWRMTQIIVRFFNGSKEIKSNMIRAQRHLADNEERSIWMDAKMPNEIFDRIEFSTWNANGDKYCMLTNLSVIAFDGGEK
jgi:hypothetical protein